jgi:arylsulfatase A-like enzyme
MGFWKIPVKGRSTKSDQLMATLLQAQKEGKVVGDKSRLDLDAAEIPNTYASSNKQGHAAWLDWPWKSHRIELKNGGVRFELYHLADDPTEKGDLATEHPERIELMKVALESWQKSVMRSYNGIDYQ